MILTRDKGQRMWGGGGGSSYSYGGGGGGESPSFDGFVSNEYYNQNFELLYKQEVTVGGTTTTTFMTAAPNVIVSVGTVTDETTQATTVTSLVGPVAKNAIVLGNIMMVYDQTNNAIKVVNRDGSTAANFYATGGVSALGYSPSGGGGGGADLNALLDSINDSDIGNTMPTAAGQVITWNGTQWIFDIPEGGGGTGTVTQIYTGTGLSGGPITTTGTIAISSTYQGYISHGETAYGWGNHANAGYLTQSSLSGYATQQWVNQQGFLTSSAISDMATKTWVGQQGFLTSSSISDMATKTWVNQQGFLTSETYQGTVTSVKMTVPTGFSVSGSPITSSGTLVLDFANGYSLPTTDKQLNWDTAYGWGNHAAAGYMLRTEGMRFTVYDNSYVAARFVNADGTYDSTRAAKALGSGYIEWWSDGYFNHRMGSVSICDGVDNDTCYLQIGGGRIYWDPSSKSLYVVQSDGSTPANLYATGGVSALGISTGGSPSVSELTVGTLKGVRYLQNASGAVSITSGNSYIYIGAGSGSNVYIADSSNTYFDTNGHLHLTGKRLYLDSTRYVYVSSGHLYFYNGSSSVQIV